MREVDDNIQLYIPVLRRIIILVAVIIAVPVVLWTITAFVRTYVAPPKVPTFRSLAEQALAEAAQKAAAQSGPLRSLAPAVEQANSGGNHGDNRRGASDRDGRPWSRS